MSNLSAHRPADYRLESFLPKDLGWEEEALFKSGFKGREYGETDWSDVPKIDYASGEFNQLSIPEPAEVVDDGDAGDFVLDDLDSLRQMGKRGGSDSNEADKQEQGTPAIGKQPRQARALTLELVKTKYKIQDLGQSERLAREKLKNPEAHSNEDQPFIPTYGESRKALLRKLGFSDDYELSLSGTAKDKKVAKAKTNSEDESEREAGVDKSLDGKNLDSSLDQGPNSLGVLSADDENSNPLDAEVLEESSELEADGRELAKKSSDDSLVEGKYRGSNDGKEADDQENGKKEQEASSTDDTHATLPDLSADQAKLAADKAFEEGYQKGLLEGKEKAAVQESLQEEIAQKEEQKREEASKQKDAQYQLQREQERKEYENEIQNLKDKIKSFDESLLGELEKKKEQLDKEMKPKVKVLTDLCDQLKALTEDSQSFFEPLKRLSVHIAEQLVLGELSASPKVVERLIKRCIDELDMRDNPVVKVELNPLDKTLLESAVGSNLARLSVSAAQNMQVGSVRVSVNDTQIEDLIQNRLETIATRLLGQPETWREHSGLMNKAVDQNYFDTSKTVTDSDERSNGEDSPRPLSSEKENTDADTDTVASAVVETDLAEDAKAGETSQAKGNRSDEELKNETSLAERFGESHEVSDEVSEQVSEHISAASTETEFLASQETSPASATPTQVEAVEESGVKQLADRVSLDAEDAVIKESFDKNTSSTDETSLGREDGENKDA